MPWTHDSFTGSKRATTTDAREGTTLYTLTLFYFFFLLFKFEEYSSTRRQWWLGGSPVAEVVTASLIVDQESHLWRMPQHKIKQLKQGEEEGHREPVFHGTAVNLLADC